MGEMKGDSWSLDCSPCEDTYSAQTGAVCLLSAQTRLGLGCRVSKVKGG